MAKDWIQETKKPAFWICDYGNVWNSSALQVLLAKRDRTLADLNRNPLQTFGEYSAKTSYYGQRCDLRIIPKRFIQRNDRLVRIYNNLIARAEIDLERLERAVNLGRKNVYRY